MRLWTAGWCNASATTKVDHYFGTGSKRSFCGRVTISSPIRDDKPVFRKCSYCTAVLESLR